ncbi:MAG: CBS domain-containing protein [Alphaproteobacteria bacterium]|nr:MAG: CBS domain-containing protein [Alphaproteobacteria bacterium]
MATLGEVADLLEAKRIKRLPVVGDGKIVGVVSRTDLLTYFRQLVVGKIGESVQTQWHEHGSSGRRGAPSG